MEAPLLDSADNILANVAGEPLVYGCDLASETLQLVDRHGADLNKRAGQKVLNAFLGRSQFDAVGLRTGRVLERALCQKLEYGPRDLVMAVRIGDMTSSASFMVGAVVI